MDDKNEIYGVNYGWFTVEKKDISQSVTCKDIKDENECNNNVNCRYRNNKCINKRKLIYLILS